MLHLNIREAEFLIRVLAECSEASKNRYEKEYCRILLERIHKMKLWSGSQGLNRKVTEAQVLRIKQLHATGRYSYSQLAALFPLSRATIGRIVSRQDYDTIEPEIKAPLHEAEEDIKAIIMEAECRKVAEEEVSNA